MFIPVAPPSRFAERAASLAYRCNLGELADSARWLTFAPDLKARTRYAVYYRQHGTKTYLLIPRDKTHLFTAIETDSVIRQGGRTYRVRHTPIHAGEHARAARLFRRYDADCHIIRLDRVERVPNGWLQLPRLPTLPKFATRVLRVRHVLPIASAVLAVGAVVGVGMFTSVNLRK